MNFFKIYTKIDHKILKYKQTINMMIRFMIYGFIGWCVEVLWTGLGSAFAGDKRLIGHTYLWMFLIYGCAIFLEPIHNLIINWPLWMRGVIWVILIYFMEYISGSLIKYYIGECPWDYGGKKYAVRGLIRLDYAPAWFIAGLLFEKLHIWLNILL